MLKQINDDIDYEQTSEEDVIKIKLFNDELSQLLNKYNAHVDATYNEVNIIDDTNLIIAIFR